MRIVFILYIVIALLQYLRRPAEPQIRICGSAVLWFCGSAVLWFTGSAVLRFYDYADVQFCEGNVKEQLLY